MRISVYVPSHNNEGTLEEVLGAIAHQTRRADQLLFIDDRCTDRSVKIARESGFDVHVLSGEGGLARARNLALGAAEGEILQGIDSDVVIAANYLESVERKFSGHPETAAIGGRLNERFAAPGPDLWRAVHFPQHHGDQTIANPRLLFGSTLAVRIAAAREIGGWGERFATTFEDVDFSERLRAAGGRMMYEPDCRAEHLRRDTLDSVLRMAWAYNYYGFEEWFGDLGSWARMRAPVYWQVHSQFRARETQYPQLANVTTLFPWAWAMRDVNALRENIGDVGNLSELAALSGRILTDHGMNVWNATTVVKWLQQLAASLDAECGSRGKLDEVIVKAIESEARQVKVV